MQHFTGSIHALKSQWDRAMKPFKVNPHLSQNLFIELVAAYSNPKRFYHNLNHVKQVLTTIEEIRQHRLTPQLTTLDFSIIRVAAWFHDIFYDPKSDDNEEKSANYAELALNQLKLPIAPIRRIKTLILQTKTHQASANELDCQILLDADLAILGTAELDYYSYAYAIRQEYSWIPDQIYRPKRKQILQNFCQRERLYLTNPMFNQFEERARQNLHLEISLLSS